MCTCPRLAAYAQYVQMNVHLPASRSLKTCRCQLVAILLTPLFGASVESLLFLGGGCGQRLWARPWSDVEPHRAVARADAGNEGAERETSEKSESRPTQGGAVHLDERGLHKMRKPNAQTKCTSRSRFAQHTNLHVQAQHQKKSTTTHNRAHKHTFAIELLQIDCARTIGHAK